MRYAFFEFLYFDSYLTKLDEFIRTGINFVSIHFFSNRNTGICHQKELEEDIGTKIILGNTTATLTYCLLQIK